MQATKNDNSTAAERLIAAHDGDVALLYIYYRHTGSLDLEQAARALCRTLQDMKAAEEKLRRLELLEETPVLPKQESDSPRFLAPADDELPQYSSQEIAKLAEGNPGFQGVCAEAARVKGKQLNANELGILAGIYDYLALPPEVILMLLNYCLETVRVRHPGSRPGFRKIQQEAFRWANLELLTLEQAEAFIRREREHSGAVSRLQTMLGLQERALTTQEKSYLSSWVDMGFEETAIQLAYERTIDSTGSLKWPYMDKILHRWHEKGLHDKKSIEEKDPRRPSAAKAPVSGKNTEPIDLDKLKELLNNI